MTEKRFEYIRTKYRHYIQDVEKDGEWKKGYKGTYDDFDLDKITDLLNQLNDENEQLKQEKKSKRKPKYIHQHIIRITYPYQTDVEDTKYMIKHIKSVITRETGVEPTIEEYLL